MRYYLAALFLGLFAGGIWGVKDLLVYETYGDSIWLYFKEPMVYSIAASVVLLFLFRFFAKHLSRGTAKVLKMFFGFLFWGLLAANCFILGMLLLRAGGDNEIMILLLWIALLGLNIFIGLSWWALRHYLQKTS